MDMKTHSRVLIVDDMRVNRMILSSLLASNGVKADLAESGAKCLELCQEHEYDLILLDHRMPEIDGVDALVHLKEMFRKTGREIPVVCHTTEDARKNINLYKAAGFADVLIKPIKPQELSKILMTYLPEGNQINSPKEEERLAKLRREIEELPDWLTKIPGIDVADGVENCDTAEDYLDALAVFASSVETKASELEKFMADGNYDMYTLKVHSLKSMARLIGAKNLSDAAAELEHAGKEGNIDIIKEKTPALIAEYRSYSKYLSRLDEI